MRTNDILKSGGGQCRCVGCKVVVMSRENLVHRLIAFLKKPDALDHHNREPVRNAYDGTGLRGPE